MRQLVIGFVEEWRTSTWRVQRPGGGATRRSYGRACLHVRLACGHYVQRMRPLDRAGNFKAPRAAECHQCGSEDLLQ
jgi:hypothetical protein